MFGAPHVSVLVGDREFKLPKGLICYHSRYFDAAFHGGFKEAAEQKLIISDYSTDTFALLVQWIFNRNVVLPDADLLSKAKDELAATGIEIALKLRYTAGQREPRLKKTKIQQNIIKFHQERIPKLIDFLRLADEVDLLGPFSKIMHDIEKTYRANYCTLNPAHIRSVAKFPRKHPLRKVIAQACVGDYITSTLGAAVHDKSLEFGFLEELDEVEEFASDLMKKFQNVMATRSQDEDGVVTVIDPFNKNVVINILVG